METDEEMDSVNQNIHKCIEGFDINIGEHQEFLDFLNNCTRKQMKIYQSEHGKTRKNSLQSILSISRCRLY